MGFYQKASLNKQEIPPRLYSSASPSPKAGCENLQDIFLAKSQISSLVLGIYLLVMKHHLLWHVMFKLVADSSCLYVAVIY